MTNENWCHIWICRMKKENVPFFGFTLVIKLRIFYFESPWNILISFDKKIHDVRFVFVPWKNGLYYFISSVWIQFSHKTERFRFWKSLNIFCFLIKKKIFQIWICPAKQCLIWFKIRCFSRILAISWEIGI